LRLRENEISRVRSEVRGVDNLGNSAHADTGYSILDTGCRNFMRELGRLPSSIEYQASSAV